MKSFIIASLITSGCFFIGLASCAHGPPPCDKVTLANIVATCPTKDECHRLIEEREKTCGTRIIEEDAGTSAGGKAP